MEEVERFRNGRKKNAIAETIKATLQIMAN